MKARCLYNDGPEWESIDIREVKNIRLTSFSYFNIEFKDGNIFSYDKLDMTE